MRFGKNRTEEPPRPQRAVPQPSTGGEQTQSVLGAGMVVTGDCVTRGDLRVDGRVTGSVRARQLTVGPDGKIEGDVAGPDDGPAEGGVVVEGQVSGTVRAQRAEVARGGSVGNGLRVREAVVSGRVVGTIVAEQRLLLEDTAVVEGDVTAPRLGVQEGGRVTGTMKITPEARAEVGSTPARESRKGPSAPEKPADKASGAGDLEPEGGQQEGKREAG